jgi:type II secretory pathway pseudopilin PulG
MSRVVPRRPSSPRALRRSSAGFTLIELTVSLVAGLIVALAVATLSREATASFHEEVRISAAEAGLRTAVDRLRADLQRAAFMSTSNIQIEPMIGKAFDQPNVAAAAPAGIKGLQSVHLTAGSSTLNATNGLDLDTTNNLTPASIDITGNLTSTEQFETQGPFPSGACCRFNLTLTSAAMFRVLASNDAGAPSGQAAEELRAIFQPVAATNTTSQFLVRVTDLMGRSQYLLTCPGQAAAGIEPGPPLVPYVLTTACPSTTSEKNQFQNTGNDPLRINPVVTARWQIVGPTGTGDKVPTQDINGLDNKTLSAGRDPSKYDLLRSYLDGSTGAVIDETSEVLAEYAVDLDFAFAVDTTADTTGAAPNIQTFDFGDPANQTVADTVATGTITAGGKADHVEPQRIRSVRFRLATRAAQGDRTASIPVQTMGDGGGGTFLYRYCLTAGGCSGNTLLQWARVRTLVGEVSLPNQQQAFY